MSDPVRAYMVVCSDSRRAVCNFCEKELSSNVTYFKRHIVSRACCAPDDVKSKLVGLLLSGQHNVSANTDRLQRLKRTLDDVAVDVHAPGMLAGGKRPNTGTGGDQSTVDAYVKVMSEKERDSTDELLARWVYREALPFRLVESSNFLAFTRSLNPAYKPPSKHSMANRLLKNAFVAKKAVVEPLLRQSKENGNLVIGGDQWSDTNLTSINNIVLFTPFPVYMETAVWPEERHTADNTNAFYVKRIEELGPRNVFAFVSDTENKMQAVWAALQLKYPWLVVLPCAGHGYNLLLADLSKHTLLAKGLTFCNNMTQFWRHHSTPKQILERCQTVEYGSVRQLERPVATRWKSQVTAAESLYKTQTAIEKAAVDGNFRALCLRSPTASQREAAAAAVMQIKDEANWDALKLVVDLLKPVAKALDVAQRDGGGLGLVMHSFFLMDEHFTNFQFPMTTAGRQLKTHSLSCLSRRRSYLLRPVHTLAYLLDPRFSRAACQPSGAEVGEAVARLKSLAEAHDTRAALCAARETAETKLPNDYPRPTRTNILGEYTDFRSRTGGAFFMDTTWEEGTVRNPLSWWQAWAAHLPALTSVALKVMKLPLSFAAGERSFSNAAHIQGKLRTRLTHERLHQLLYVYYNSRSLSHLPVGMGGHVAAAPELGEGSRGEAAEDADTVGSDGEGGLDLLAAAAAMETIAHEGME